MTDYMGSPEGDILKKIIDPEDKLTTWTLVHTPYPVLTVLSVYLVVVLKLGPSIMQSRDPIELHNTMRVYNLFQVLSNLFIVLRLLLDPEAIVGLIRTQCCSLEEMTNVQYDQLKYRMLWYGWVYLILKMTDLLDTVFMVMRKKKSHITFLHLYHHTAMVFFVWLCFKHSKSHHGVIPVVINTAVHVVMYSYYFLATFPALKPRLWWKKHLTKFQLGQFAVILVYFALLYFLDCPIPRIFTYVWIFNVSVFGVLFINFYIKAYIKENHRSSDKSS